MEVSTLTPTSALDLYLFACDGGSVQCVKARMYACKLYSDGTLVRDYVPCIDPAGAAGLYDLVGGRFYGSAGTGTFTAGPEGAFDADALITRMERSWYYSGEACAGEI